jgi:hypothetical protein
LHEWSDGVKAVRLLHGIYRQPPTRKSLLISKIYFLLLVGKPEEANGILLRWGDQKKKEEEIDFFFFRKYFPFIGRETKKEKETQTNPLCPKFNKPTFIKKKKKKGSIRLSCSPKRLNLGSFWAIKI